MATHQIAKGIAQLGRNGDSTLVHMQPNEVAGLQAIAKSQGTSLTINPETGLPEAFSLGGFFNALLPVFAGAATGGAGAPLWAGIAAGAATGAITNRKDPLMGAVTGGMGGYGGFNLGQGFASAGAGTAAPASGGIQLGGSAAAPTGAGVQLGSTAANQIPSGALDRALATSGANFDPIARGTAQNIVANTGPGVAFKNTFAQPILPGDAGYLGQSLSGREIMGTGAIGSASPGGAYSASQGLQNMGQGFQNVVTGQEGAWDAFKQGLAGAGKAPVSNFSAATSIGMPLGGAALSGLEYSDIYGDPIRMGKNPNEKYDPSKSLDLSGDTGLRFDPYNNAYAGGGPVSFADGGDTDKDPINLPGGDVDVSKGSDILPVDVSDINAKYGLDEKSKFVPAPKLGLFADNDQIETARTAYEAQLKAAMSGRGGMGSPYGFGGMGRMMGSNDGMVRGIGGLQNSNGGMNSMGMMSGSLGSTANTAPTASTAETALARLDLNKNYAAGGYVNPFDFRSGGLNSLAEYGDNPVGYAEGGNVRTSYGGVGDNGITTYVTGGPQYEAMLKALGNHFRDVNPADARMTGPYLSQDVSKLPPSKKAEDMVRMFQSYADTPNNESEALRGGNLNLYTESGLGMAKGGYLDGPGDGMSDSIPATIEGKQPARLADGEFVIPADVVSHLGNGSTKAGSQRLYGMLDKVRKARTGTKKQGKQIKPEKYMPA